MTMPQSFTVGKAPGALPLAGHIRSLVKDPLAFLSSLPEHGDLVWIKIGPLRAIVACHPELTRELLRRDEDFDKGGQVMDRAREFIGDGLITCVHSDHSRHRRMMQPAFQTDRFPAYASVMTEQIAAVTANWREGHIIDAFDDIHVMTSKTMSIIMFASEISASAVSRFREALGEILDGTYRRMLTPPGLDRLPTPGKRRYDRARACLREITSQFTDNIQDGADRDDLMSMLLTFRDDDGQSLSADEICDQVTSLFSAGTETTASTVGWALHYLACDPQLQQRLRAEARTVLGGRTASWEDVPSLHYARRTIWETLRICPPAWLLTRKATCDTELGGCQIPAGTTLVYSAYLLHHRADIFADPDRFDPDRWNDTKPPRGGFVPFGNGPRKCIGDNIAMTQAILMLSSIISRWQVTPVAENIRPVPRLVLTPRRIQLRLNLVPDAEASIAGPPSTTRARPDQRCPGHEAAGPELLKV
jgi:pentalenene oxygenase